MKRLIFVAVTLIGILLASPVFSATPFEARSELMVPFQSDGTIEINNDTGFVEVVTWDKPDVKIAYKKFVRFDSSAQAKNLLDASKADARVFGNNLKISNYAPTSKREYGNARVMFDYKLWIPKNSNLFVKTDAGKIEIYNLTGKCEAKSNNGNILLKNIDGPITANTNFGHIDLFTAKGNVELATKGGNIKADYINGPLSVHTNDGIIRLNHIKGPSLMSKSKSGNQYLAFVEVEGKPMIHTESGDIRLTWFKSPAIAKTDSGSITVVSLTSEVADESTFKSVTGPVDVKDMKGNAIIETSKADAAIKLFKGDMKFNSDHGSLEVANLYGTVEAKSNSGDIDVRAKSKDLAKPIKLETASGDIYLSLPTKTPADVALKTTKGTIKTNFPMKPQRGLASYEAEGKINGGGTRVELNSQSGDIQLDRY